MSPSNMSLSKSYIPSAGFVENLLQQIFTTANVYYNKCLL